MSKHDECCERNGPEQMFCGCEDRKELDRLRTERDTILHKAAVALDALRTENATLRSLLEEVVLEQEVRGLDMSSDLIERVKKEIDDE